MDPHSIDRLDPDPHSECGSGSRRGKMSPKRKKLTLKTRKKMKIITGIFFAVIYSPKNCSTSEKTDEKKINFVNLQKTWFSKFTRIRILIRLQCWNRIRIRIRTRIRIPYNQCGSETLLATTGMFWTKVSVLNYYIPVQFALKKSVRRCCTTFGYCKCFLITISLKLFILILLCAY
jgi:hypothetical protein